MLKTEWKNIEHGSFVMVEGVGLMQVWKFAGIKCLRAHGMMGYNFYEITDFSKVHRTPTAKQDS